MQRDWCINSTVLFNSWPLPTLAFFLQLFFKFAHLLCINYWYVSFHSVNECMLSTIETDRLWKDWSKNDGSHWFTFPDSLVSCSCSFCILSKKAIHLLCMRYCFHCEHSYCLHCKVTWFHALHFWVWSYFFNHYDIDTLTRQKSRKKTAHLSWLFRKLFLQFLHLFLEFVHLLCINYWHALALCIKLTNYW